MNHDYYASNKIIKSQEVSVVPAINGIYFIHPKTKEEGLWVDLCTNNLEIKGLSKTSSSLLSVGSTKEQTEEKIQKEIQTLATDVVTIKVKLRSLTPLEIEYFEVSEGTSKSYSV